jgi:DNA-binding NtrC family response regulator
MGALYRKLLVIEDDDLFSTPLVRFLTQNQFQVNLAKEATFGVELQENINFDLIITDLQMDGMSGKEAIDKIAEKYPETKIIVMSGYIGVKEEFCDIKNNPYVCAVFEKPIDYMQPLETIKANLS